MEYQPDNVALGTTVLTFQMLAPLSQTSYMNTDSLLVTIFLTSEIQYPGKQVTLLNFKIPSC